MKTHLVRMQLVSLAVLALTGEPVSAQVHRPLSFATTSPCIQPPSRFATFTTALDVVVQPSTDRLHYIVGVSRDHVVESVMFGPRAANALDIGAGLQLGPHAAIEMEIQWLEKAVGPTRWMAPIRIRWR